ncbi:MAG: hypothetical protein IH897_01025 [Planctomycetes bacterium]|nr:hypothetical protein [Planctomycetota bacterium]
MTLRGTPGSRGAWAWTSPSTHADAPKRPAIILPDTFSPFDQQTRFTFNDGTTTNEVVYTLVEPPPIPATSSWGMIALVLFVLIAGTLALRARTPTLPRFC